MADFGVMGGIPGQSDIRESAERNVLWSAVGSSAGEYRYRSVLIDSTAVDSGNSPTTIIRPGLVVGELDSGAGYVDYDPDATDGSQIPKGILVDEVPMLDFNTHAAADRWWRMLVQGGVIASECINLDVQARRALNMQGIVFDNTFESPAALASYKGVITKSTTATLTAAESGNLILVTGAATITLPAIAVGLSYEILNSSDTTLTVASGEGDNVVAFNDASADSIAFDQAGEKIGGRLRLEAIYVGATLKWIVSNLSAGAHTLTVAT